MRVTHALARYFPDAAKMGGMQMHVAQLARHLRAFGVNSNILASSDEQCENAYLYEGTPVFRYPTAPEPPREPNHGHEPHLGFDAFVSALTDSNPDLYHQHQWTPKCGMQHLRAAVKLGIPTVVSFHVPMPLCPREDGMYLGRRQCDTFLDPARCESCATSNSSILELVRLRRESLQEIATIASRLIVAADWLKSAVLQQGFPEKKLIVSSYAVQRSTSAVAVPKRRKLRFVFFGRWTPDKGPHIAIAAFKQASKEIWAELHLYGMAQDGLYEQNILQLASDDPGIFVHKSLSVEAMLEVMRNSDAVLIPSQWLETGPLVALHARDVGTPVIGSRLGGIVEEIEDGRDGILVTHDSIQEWAAAMLLIGKGGGTVFVSPRAPRTAAEEAQTLAHLYKELRD